MIYKSLSKREQYFVPRYLPFQIQTYYSNKKTIKHLK